MSEAEKVEIEYTEVEQEAMEEGWIPPDRFEKADKGREFVSAEKYLDRAPFFKKISEKQKQIDDLRETVEGIKSHTDKVLEQQLEAQKVKYEQQIQTLEEQKIQALDEGDHREAGKIDKEIRKVEKQSDDAVAPVADNAIFEKWVNNNSWYNEDKFLKREATLIGEQLANSEGLRGKALFDEVSSFIKEKYPNKFENQKRNEAASVEGGGNAPQSKSKIPSDKDLTADERQVYNKWDRSGMFKNDGDGSQRKSYLKEVIANRELS